MVVVVVVVVVVMVAAVAPAIVYDHKGALALRFPNGDLLTDVNLKLDEYCISLRDAVRRVRTQQGSEQA